ncbi:hypothetical protein SUGI_0297600 [Cryptomeria japonica]|nr:hypothetical protein SUGI_0297600 [Cryptomeria japonica]
MKIPVAERTHDAFPLHSACGRNKTRPGKRSRISLGSYFTPEATARAYDAALLCLRGPHASSFNFPDSQFNSTVLEMAAAQSNPSPHVIRTAAIAVGFEFDSVPARYHHNVEGGKASTHTGQGVNNQQITETVGEEEDMCEANDTKYLLQSHEEISYEERVQMSLISVHWMQRRRGGLLAWRRSYALLHNLV